MSDLFELRTTILALAELGTVPSFGVVKDDDPNLDYPLHVHGPVRHGKAGLQNAEARNRGHSDEVADDGIIRENAIMVPLFPTRTIDDRVLRLQSSRRQMLLLHSSKGTQRG